MIIEKGLIVNTRTYSKFLNKTFNINYKRWCKSTFVLSDEIVVLIIRLDSKEREDFRNYMDGNNIIEESACNPTRSYKPIRLVFQVIDGQNDYRNFVCLGKYKMSCDSSTERSIFVPFE